MIVVTCRSLVKRCRLCLKVLYISCVILSVYEIWDKMWRDSVSVLVRVFFDDERVNKNMRVKFSPITNVIPCGIRAVLHSEPASDIVFRF